MADATNWKAVSPENKRKVSPLMLREDAIVPLNVGDAVRESLGDLSLGRSGEIVAEKVAESGAYVYDVRWADGSLGEGVRQYELRNVMDLRESPLMLTVELGDPSLLEAATKAPMSNVKRRPGESLTQHGHRLKADDRRLEREAEAKKKTRGGGDQDFEREHPRSRSGEWTLKSGAKGDAVRVVQRRVGAKPDGDFGAGTRQAVMDFQRRNGLTVDGVVGRQTIAAMRGDVDADALKPGAATAADRRWLAARARRRQMRESATDGGLAVKVETVGALGLMLGDDLTLTETPDTGEIHEEADLALVETVDGHSHLLALVESAVPATAQFNADGTIDFVIIRPCNGRGLGNRIYEAQVLARDAHVFTGVSAYDNHESPEAARARRGIPRPPSELAGEVRESWWDPSFTTPEDEKFGFEPGAVIGRFMLTEDMERLVRRLPRAVKVSVNAQATSMRAGMRNGKRGMIVEGIVNDPENTSVDLVTKAGAGGQVASLYRELAAA